MCNWKLLGAVLVGVLAVVLVAAVPAVKPDQGGPDDYSTQVLG